MGQVHVRVEIGDGVLFAAGPERRMRSRDMPDLYRKCL
jgi:hypothetical protein